MMVEGLWWMWDRGHGSVVMPQKRSCGEGGTKTSKGSWSKILGKFKVGRPWRGTSLLRPLLRAGADGLRQVSDEKAEPRRGGWLSLLGFIKTKTNTKKNINAYFFDRSVGRLAIGVRDKRLRVFRRNRSHSSLVSELPLSPPTPLLQPTPAVGIVISLPSSPYHPSPPYEALCILSIKKHYSGGFLINSRWNPNWNRGPGKLLLRKILFRKNC